MPKRKKQPDFVSRLKAIRDSRARHKFHLKPDENLGEHLAGYLLAFSEDLLVIHNMLDFEPDGYSIRPLATLSDISKADHDFYHMVCEREGWLSGLSPSWELDLSSMRNAIEDIQQRYKYLGLYWELEPGDFSHSIGRVVYFDETSLIIQQFWHDGEWADLLLEIWYEDIHRVEFDTPYINMFAKYIEEPPEPDFSQYDHLKDLDL